MRVALLTSEAFPFAKTGGLADVSGALPKALNEQDVDARLILPLYDQIDRKLVNGDTIDDIRVEWRGQIHLTRAWQSDAAGAPTYLIEAPEFFAREGIYGHNDDHIRFAFFSRAALGLLKALDWQPDVVHGNDWPCGFAAAELRARRRLEPFFQKTKSLFSLHNVGYQGLFSAGDLWWLGFGDPPERDDFMLERHASALKAGIITGRTQHVYGAWMNMDELAGEGDFMVGDAIAAEGIEYLREINRKRRVIGQKPQAA